MRIISNEMRKYVEMEIMLILAESVSETYARYILAEEYKDGQTIMDAIIQNIMETSAWEENGCYSEDDARFSIGRILMDKMNINV